MIEEDDNALTVGMCRLDLIFLLKKAVGTFLFQIFNVTTKFSMWELIHEI